MAQTKIFTLDLGKEKRFCNLWLQVVLLVFAFFLKHPEADAFVHSTTTHSSMPLYWKGSNCVFIRPSTNMGTALPLDETIQAIANSLDNWQKVIARCSYITMSLLPASPNVKTNFDRENPHLNENVISWVEKDWDHGDKTPAITFVFFNESDGQIFDADIEFNGATPGIQFGLAGESGTFDFENTLTHELGHLLGLSHVCDDRKQKPVPLDHEGKVIPPCSLDSALPKWVRDATMYNFADRGEISKRTPKADDILGICQTYPKSEDPGVCKPPNYERVTPNCAMGDGNQPMGIIFWVVLVAMMILIRSRGIRR